jgi:quercetin dioxygenase-like cupin family protein
MKEGVSHIVQSTALTPIPFPIPGATPGGVQATLLNIDGAKGIVTTIIHIAPGATIPAHWHNDGAEAHYVLEGDFINAGVTHGPGAFITHPVGVVHGPHGSAKGCKVLTLQTAFVDPANPDFHIVSG